MTEQTRSTVHTERLQMEQSIRSNFVVFILSIAAFMVELVLLLAHGIYSVEKLSMLSDSVTQVLLAGNGIIFLSLIWSIINIALYSMRLRKIEPSITRSRS